MDHRLVLQGVVVGFGVAAPVGPIGILVIRRSVTERATLGFATGLGAAAADTLFAALGALGLFAIATRLGPHQALLRGLGGAIVGVLGARALIDARRSREGAAASGESRHVHLRAFGATFVLTISNPMTVASFAAMAASVGIGARGGGGAADAVSFVSGVFLGSSAWWLALSWAASLLRGRLSTRSLVWIDRISGAVLLTLGVLAIASAVVER